MMSAATLWLDHLIFGSGYGMKSPYHDDKYYWLSGRIYTWIGGLDAQLHSTQWRHPLPGERRRLNGREYVVFNSSRRWCRVQASWALVGLPRPIDEANAIIREVERELDRLMPPLAPLRNGAPDAR